MYTSEDIDNPLKTYVYKKKLITIRASSSSLG